MHFSPPPPPALHLPPPPPLGVMFPPPNIFHSIHSRCSNNLYPTELARDTPRTITQRRTTIAHQQQQQTFPAASLPPPHCWWTVGSRGGGATAAAVAVQQQQQQDELAAKGGITTTTTTAAARMSPSPTALAFGNGGRLLLHTPSPSSSTTAAAAAATSTASTLSPAGTMCYVGGGGGGGGVARERSLLPFPLNPTRPSSNPATAALTNWHYQQPKQFQQAVPSFPRYGGQPPYPTTNAAAAAAASVAIGSDYLRNVPSSSSWSVLPNYPTMSPHHQQQQQLLLQQHHQHYAMPTSSVRVVQPQRHHQPVMASTAASSLMGRHYQFYASAYRNHPSFASSSSPLSLSSPVSVAAAAQPFYHQKTVAAMPSAQYPPAYRPSLVSSHHNLLQNYYGVALPPSAAGAGADFGQYAAPSPFGQYQSPQWAAFQQQQQQQQAPQGMYPPRMAPPPPQQMRQQQQQMPTAPQQFGTATAAGQADDEQQQRLQSTSASSRLSTPVPQQTTTTTDQRPISRASSSSAAPVEQQQQQQRTTTDPQQDERGEGGGGGTVQQQQRQAQTPSAFSANAPTPPLTTSTATSVQLTPSVATATAAGVVPFYHPNAPYGVGRFPSSANEAMYGPSAGPYTSSQQALPFTHQQQRYQQQQAAAAAAVGRYYPPLSGASSSAASASMGTPQSAKSGASSTPKGFPTGGQQQQQQIVPSAFYASGNRASATALLGVVPPPAGILPSSVGPMAAVPPAYGGQQPLYAMPTSSTMAWHAAVFQQHHQFPPHSLEAHTIAQVQQQTKRQRDKVYARDLWGATPARIVMALRSALHTETVWALNALNVQLYDDTSLSANAAPSLAQTPELLNLLVDHLAATLSLLFPDHFDTKTFGGRGQPGSPNSNHRISSSNATAAAATSSFCSANGVCAAATNSSSSSNGSSLLVPKHESLVLFDKVEVLVPNLPLTTTPRGSFVMTPNGRSQQHRQQQQQQAQQNGIICTTTNNSNNFTMVSRLGRRVKLDSAAGEVLPPALVRELRLSAAESDGEAKDEEVPFLHFVERVRQSVLGNVRAQGAPRRRANGFGWKANGAEEERKKQTTKEFWEKEEQQELKKRGEPAEIEQNAVPRRARLFFHRADDDGDDSCSCNRWHINNSKCNGSEHFTLLARPVVLQDAHADERMGALMEQCLALANILRGYAFLPGHERTLGAHAKLLRLLSVLMMLMVDGTERKRKTNTEQASRAKQHHHSPDMILKMKDEETEQKHLAKEEQQQQSSSSSEGISASDMERSVEKAAGDMPKPEQKQQQTAAAVPAEVDTPRKWLLEVANQLRDDAFVIMAQLSAHLDLFDVDSAISWPIFDALLHWSVSSDVQARDPLPPFGAVSPRHYALEILCKMSVMEHNVDLLVSTGSWLRLEAFVRLLCAQICEEPPVREFAIVILNAVCAASEPACYVAAVETPLLEHLVSFLEAADANMTQIVQQQGMHALRENPEIIGTSVGMLRRATTIMVQIAKHEQCREHFRRLQHRLLQFTVSHFMDLRVAAMVANILFEIQRDSVPVAEAKRGGGGGENGTTTTAADQTRKEGHLPLAPPPVVGEDVERKASECLAPAPFMLGSDRNALFNGTAMSPSTSNNNNKSGNGTSSSASSCAAATSNHLAAAAASVYVPPMVMKQEKKDENANACGDDHVDNDDKADTNRRKRVHNNNNNNSNNNNNHYEESNGHAGGGGRRTVTRTPDTPVGQSVDELPMEKRPRMDDANTPPPMMSMNNNNSSSTTTSSVKVRERMRHNILSKKASLKVAAASAEVMAASPLHSKRNGWIAAAVGAADGHCDEQQQQQQRQQTKKMLHNGIGTESGKSGGEAMPTQNASTSPAASSGGGAGGSSLTAVA